MKKLIVLLMSAILCASFCACNNNDDTKNEATETSTQASTTAVTEETIPETENTNNEEVKSDTENSDTEETQTATEAQTESETQPSTEAETEAETMSEADIAKFTDLEGLWKHSEKGDHNTVRVTCGQDYTMYLTISAIKGEASQIASCEVETKIIKSDNYPNGKGTFTYEDSFGNKGEGEIIINSDSDSLTLTINETELASNWGIRASSGDYTRG